MCDRCGRPGRNKLKDCKAYKQTCKLCFKPNHFAVVCCQKERKKNPQANSGEPFRKHVRQVTEETNESDDKPSDSDDSLLKIEVSSVKSKGKQLLSTIVFSDPEEKYFREVEF